jgi:hypothetical protein
MVTLARSVIAAYNEPDLTKYLDSLLIANCGRRLQRSRSQYRYATRRPSIHGIFRHSRPVRLQVKWRNDSYVQVPIRK